MNRTIRIRLLRFTSAAAVAVGAVLVPLASGGVTAATALSLTFDGAHVPDSELSGGLRHDGRFTASEPLCPTGRAYDVRHFEGEMLSVLRLHTCDDGSGTFTASMPAVRSEHGGMGTWRIVEGTGRYVPLRGMGTYTATLVSGNPDLFDTIVYRTSWKGVVDFDADAPAVETLGTSVRKVIQRPRTYALRLAVAVRDTALPVSFTVDVRSGRTELGYREGATSSGRATITLRIRPPRGARSARVVLVARDAVGNETRSVRSVALR